MSYRQVPQQISALESLKKMPLVNRTDRVIDQMARKQFARDNGPPPFIPAPRPSSHDFRGVLARRPPPSVSSTGDDTRQRSATGRFRDLKDRLQHRNAGPSQMPPASDHHTWPPARAAPSTMPSAFARKQESSRPLPIVPDQPLGPRMISGTIRGVRHTCGNQPQMPLASNHRPLPPPQSAKPTTQSVPARQPHDTDLTTPAETRPVRPIRFIHLRRPAAKLRPARPQYEDRFVDDHFALVRKEQERWAAREDCDEELKASVVEELNDVLLIMLQRNVGILDDLKQADAARQRAAPASADRSKASSAGRSETSSAGHSETSSSSRSASSTSRSNKPRRIFASRVPCSGSLLAGGSKNRGHAYGESEEGSTWSASLHHSESGMSSPTRSSNSAASSAFSTVASGEVTLEGGPRYGKGMPIPRRLLACAEESDDSYPAYLIGEGPSVDESGDEADEEEPARSAFLTHSRETVAEEEEQEEEEEEEGDEMVYEEESVWSESLFSSRNVRAGQSCQEQQQQQQRRVKAEDDGNNSTSSMDMSWSQLASTLANKVVTAAWDATVTLCSWLWA